MFSLGATLFLFRQLSSLWLLSDCCNYISTENHCCVFIFNLVKEGNVNYIEVSFSELESIKLFTKGTDVRNIILWYIYTLKGKKNSITKSVSVKWTAVLSATLMWNGFSNLKVVYNDVTGKAVLLLSSYICSGFKYLHWMSYSICNVLTNNS